MTLVLVLVVVLAALWLLTQRWAWAIAAVASVFTIVGCICTLHIMGAMGACVALIVCVTVMDMASEEWS
jgi:hypothetical protein